MNVHLASAVRCAALLSLIGGAFSAPAYAQVTIRERVEVAPLDDGVPVGRGSVTAGLPPGEGLLVLHPILYGGSPPRSFGEPIGGFLFVTTTRPGGAGGPDTLTYRYDLADGFVPLDEPTGNPYQRFTHSWKGPAGAPRAITGAPGETLKPGERIIDAALSVGPEILRPWGTTEIVRDPTVGFIGIDQGCSPSNPDAFVRCAEAYPHPMVYAKFGMEALILGRGFQTVIDAPGTVACGTREPVRVRQVRADGAEGWWNPDWGLHVFLRNGGLAPDKGRFVLGDEAGTGLRTSYGAAYGGGIADTLFYHAPPCDTLPPEGRAVSYEAKIANVGGARQNVRVEHGVRLFVAPDTLRPDERAGLAVATTLPAGTRFGLAVAPAAAGRFERVGGSAKASGGGADGARVEGGAAASASGVLAFEATATELAEWQFVAGAVAEATTATITATVGGREVEAAVVVEPASPAFQLLSQNDEPYPLPAAGGAIMVSRFPTDLTLPEVSAFESVFKDRPACPDPFQLFATDLGCFDSQAPSTPPPVDRTTDRFTVRPELSGLGAGADVSFRMTISRPAASGLSVEVQSETYGAVEGGAGDYRGDRLIRFVSNARPERAPSSARYDDAVGSVAPDQTPVVRLGDAVRFEALVRGAVVETLDYAVGRPASESGPLAVRRVTLNWRISRDLERGVVPDVIASRASEDWAQAAIAVVNKPPGQRDALWGDYAAKLFNVIHIETRGGRSTRRGGSISIPVVLDGGSCARTPTVSYDQGATPEDLRNLAVLEVQAACGVRVFATPDEAAGGGASNSSGRFVDDADADGFYITVGAAHRVSIDKNWNQRSGLVTASSVTINTNGALSLPAMAATAAALRDEDPATVDVIALPDRTLLGDHNDLRSAVLGFGFDDSRANSPLINVLLIGELNERDVGTGFRVVSAVDDLDDFPFVVGHELGHVLAGAGHPNQGIGEFGVEAGHPLVLRHIMATTGDGLDLGAPEAEFVGGPKRMNETFVGRARGSSAAQLRGSGPTERQSASAAARRRASSNQ